MYANFYSYPMQPRCANLLAVLPGEEHAALLSRLAAALPWPARCLMQDYPFNASLPNEGLCRFFSGLQRRVRFPFYGVLGVDITRCAGALESPELAAFLDFVKQCQHATLFVFFLDPACTCSTISVYDRIARALPVVLLDGGELFCDAQGNAPAASSVI